MHALVERQGLRLDSQMKAKQFRDWGTYENSRTFAAYYGGAVALALSMDPTRLVRLFHDSMFGWSGGSLDLQMPPGTNVLVSLLPGGH